MMTFNNMLKGGVYALLAVVLLQPTAMAAKRLVKLHSGKTALVNVERVEDHWVTEGDIVVPEAKNNKEGAVVIPEMNGNRWPKAEVPFMIAGNMPRENRDNIYRAMMDIEYYTPVRFIEDNNNQHFDHLYFTPSSGCASYVGRIGGEQTVWLAPGCYKGSTIHEILHALGFWHEQSRADRESYVHIAWENITEENKHNFQQHIWDGDDLGDYNYGSIMHYGARAFSKNGLDTIIPLDRNARIGQRAGLNEGDIAAVKTLYGDGGDNCALPKRLQRNS